MKIELLFMDVDGTLTDGKVHYGQNGEVFKNFDIKDGLMLAFWNKKLSRKSAIITGRNSPIVEQRARELGVQFIFMGVNEKGARAREILDELGLVKEQAAAIGDDVNDISMFLEAGLSFAPKDCAKQIYPFVEILESCGGDGALREMIEKILESENLQDAVKDYFI